MNENKLFPEMGNDANNDLASVTPVEPVVETPEVPTMEVPVVEETPSIEPVASVEPTLEFPTMEQDVTPVSETLEVPTVEVPVMEMPVEPVMESAPVVEETVEVPTMEVPTVDFMATETPVEPVMSETNIEPTVTPEVSVAPVSPMETVSTPVETPIASETPSGESPKKKGNLLPIIIAILAVALIGVGVWFLFFRETNPVKLTTKAFDKLKANVTEIGDVLGEIKTYDKITQNGEVTVEFSSAYLASEDYEDYETLVDILKDVLLKYNMGADVSNENLFIDALLTLGDEEVFDLGIVVQNERIYFHVLDKYVDITDALAEEVEGDTEEVEALIAELEGVDGWYFYDVITKAFTDSLNEEDFETSNETITVDKKDVKVTKNELKITKNNAHRIVNSVIENVNKDKKIKKIFDIIGLDLSELKATKDDFEYMDPISINFYSKGSDLLKIEMVSEYEYEDYWDETTHTYKTIMSYTFGEKTDVIEMVEKEDGETYTDVSIELTINGKNAKVELYDSRTKVATVELKTTDESLSLTFNSEMDGSVLNASLEMVNKVNGNNYDTTVECVASIDTVEYFRVKLNDKGTFEEKYNALDLKDAIKYEDLTDEEWEEIDDYLDMIGNFGAKKQEINTDVEW